MDYLANKIVSKQIKKELLDLVSNLEKDLEVRLASGILVALDEEHVLIGNGNTGRYKKWPRAYEKKLNKYLSWQAISDILRSGVDDDENLSEFSLNLELLFDLIEIGVLEDRMSDLSGLRLSNPEGGWESAMRFLFETRTERSTIFANPGEYNAALEYKSTLVRQPSAFYERAGSKIYKLSDPKMQDGQFKDVLLNRRTARKFSEKPLTEAQLSVLLYFGWGMVGSLENTLGDLFLRKTSPSGGALHPIEVYPILMNVEGLPQGLYHYSVRRHALEEISLENPRKWISMACGDQQWVEEASVVFLCTAFLPRTAWKYQYSRVARAVFAEIGFSGQAALLTATWLGLGSFTTIALRDQIWEDKLGLEPAREPVLAVFGAGQLEEGIQNHARPRIETISGVESS